MNIIFRMPLIAITVLLSVFLHGQEANVEQEMDYMALSIEFMEALKVKSNTDEFAKIFADSTIEGLEQQINTDEKKLAFWINIYNAYIIHTLDKNPELYENRRTFFNKSRIEIAGMTIAFSDIEHGILRRGQKLVGLGLIPTLFPPKYQKRLRPNIRDYRIHFGLNCGAKSCPPVAIFHPDTVMDQLCTLQMNYLKQKTSYDANSNTVTTTPLASWFRGDFGGKKGVKNLLYEAGLIPSSKVNLKFGEYDWTLDLNMFVDI